MQVKDVKFLRSITEANDPKFIFEHTRPEICFVWRSNVWKSSILNSIFDSKSMVKTGSRAGLTKFANQFLVNWKIICVDLPGYWFARLSETQREKIDTLITRYIAEIWKDIRKVVMILDSRVWAMEKDIEMFMFLQELEIPLLIVLNKIDKLNATELAKSKKAVKEIFVGQEIITYSALKQTTRKELLREVFDIKEWTED